MERLEEQRFETISNVAGRGRRDDWRKRSWHKERCNRNDGQFACDIKSFTLSDWKLTMVDANAAMLTYKGVADGTCSGQPVPPVWASSLWVMRQGKWIAFSHQESNIKM
jgi:hypothetical protein